MTIPLISVVIPTHNRSTLLSRAVDSIQKQTFSELEIIIIDDASNDGTPDEIEKLRKQDSRIRTKRLINNSGPGVAKNEGMAMSKGEFIAIMGDDDLSVPTRLAEQLQQLQSNLNVGLVFSSVQWINDLGENMGFFPGILKKGDFSESPRAVFSLLYLESNKIPDAAIMLRRQLFLDMGGYPNEPWVGEDWYWFMQMAASGIKVMGTANPLVLVARDNKHISLMTNKKRAFTAQRKILKMTKQWLIEQNIHDFDNLHQKAMSNQLAREARFWGSWRGIGLCLQGLWLWPGSPLAQRSLREIIQRGKRKIYQR